MGLLTFPADNKPVTADASVWINLVASGYAARILSAVPYRLSITDVAVAELERGRITGRTTIVEVESLLRRGVISKVQCPEKADDLYLDLIGGSAAETLDDGEACTLAHAFYTGSVALIDERKATAVAARRFPALPVLATTDMLLSPGVVSALGLADATEALFNALRDARMRVPPRCLWEVYDTLGDTKASLCSCLPPRSRAIR